MSEPPEQPTQRARREPSTRRSRSEQARTAGLIVLAILGTLFAVLNLKDVTVNWIVGSGKAPLIIVIVVSTLGGMVLSYLADRIARKRRR
jgi:uncharacterized integral membrane protein